MDHINSMNVNKDFYISRTDNKITIGIHKSFDLYLQSIQLILESCGPIINTSNNKILFYGNKIESLSSISMTYDLTICLCACLSKQILYLEEMGFAIYGINTNDIVVVNDSLFVFVNPELIMPFNQRTGKITFVCPFKKPNYISSDIESIKILPSLVSYLVGRTALAKLCVGLLGLDKEMTTIRETKLYWFLKRCLLSPSNFILV